MVVNKKVSEIYVFCFTGYLFSLKFDGMVFVVSIISSHELSIILPTYLPFLQLHLTGF